MAEGLPDGFAKSLLLDIAKTYQGLADGKGPA
jgi:hypothetical protein